MSNLDSVLEQTMERLSEDEQWRSNLVDEEAALLLKWASQQLTASTARLADLGDEAQAQEQLKMEARRVRQNLKNLNGLLEADQIPEPAAACAALERPAPAPVEPFPDRLALLRWLVA
jgi:hypothetical protein